MQTRRHLAARPVGNDGGDSGNRTTSVEKAWVDRVGHRTFGGGQDAITDSSWSFGFARTDLPPAASADLSADGRADTPVRRNRFGEIRRMTVFDSRPAGEAGNGDDPANSACLNANPRKDRVIRSGNATHGNELYSGATP